MSKEVFLSRLRQLLAADINAQAIYSDLANQVQDSGLKEKFRQLAQEEEQHVSIIKSLIAEIE